MVVTDGGGGGGTDGGGGSMGLMEGDHVIWYFFQREK